MADLKVICKKALEFSKSQTISKITHVSNGFIIVVNDVNNYKSVFIDDKLRNIGYKNIYMICNTTNENIEVPEEFKRLV